MNKELQLQKIYWPELEQQDLKADVLRLDLIHPVISGNKWFKLKNYLHQAIQGNKEMLITWGGAYSNHVIATACAAREAGLDSIGIIRGESAPRLSPTLIDAQAYGMQLKFIPRKAYALKDEAGYLDQLSLDYPHALMIPEGGQGSPGIQGSEEILAGLKLASYSHILCAMGTGTMFTGLVNASLPHQRLIGIPVWKGMETLPDSFARNFRDQDRKHNCRIFGDYHFGGYAKWNPSLLRFMNQFYETTSIPTDFVYTGKLFYAFADLVRKKQFPGKSSLLLIHSGGLQGNRSLARGSLVF